MTSSKEALHSHGEYTYVAELIESPRYADVEYSTRQQQYEQIVLCELLRGTGGELPDWAADPKRVPFISGTTVRTSLQKTATKATWVLHGEEDRLVKQRGRGPRGVAVTQAPNAFVTDKATGAVALRASIVDAGQAEGRNRHGSFLQHVQFALDVSAVLQALIKACTCEQQQMAVLVDALVPALRGPQVGLRNARDELLKTRRQRDELTAERQRSSLKAEVKAVLDPLEEYAKKLLAWVDGEEVPDLPDDIVKKGGLLYQLLRSFMPVKDWSARRARLAEREAGEREEGEEDVRVYDKLWDELTREQQSSAELLGFSEDSWEQDDWSGVQATAWGNLPPNLQTAAEALELDEVAWEEGVGRAEAGQPQPPCEKHWDDLQPSQQRIAERLGFSATAWVENDWSAVTTAWSDLSSSMRRYAEALGFDESSWEAGSTSNVTSLLGGARDLMTAGGEDEDEEAGEGAANDFSSPPMGGNKTFGRKLLLMLFPLSWLARIGSEREAKNFTFLLTLVTWFFTRGRVTRFLQFGRGVCLLSDAKKIKPFLKTRAEEVVKPVIAKGPQELVPGFVIVLAWLDNYQKWLNLSDERVSRHGEAQKHGEDIEVNT